MSRRVLLSLAALVLLLPLSIYFVPSAVAFVYSVIFFFAPLWLPLVLFLIAWPLWLRYIRSRYVASVPYVTLELQPGTDTPQTARAMELVFYSLYQRTQFNRMQTFLFGFIRLPISFEAYGHNGRVRFFVHLPESRRAGLESRIRAEYHDLAIHVTRDYSREIHFDPFNMRIIAKEYTLAKPDPYPLKTYVTHEESRDKKDLFADVIEKIAKAGEHEHILLSYMVRPHQRDRTELLEDPKDSLHEDAHKEIAKLVGPKGDLNAVAPATKRIIGLIESALAKPSFDCGIRALYIAENEHFDEGYEEKLSTLLDPFSDSELNSFVVRHPHEKKGFILSELFSAVSGLAAGHLLDLYRRRAFFAPPYVGRAFVLNTEELATVFHIPHARRGSALARAGGVLLQPPENLPL